MRKTNFCVMLITYKRGELKNIKNGHWAEYRFEEN